jgi:hypothetical protein
VESVRGQSKQHVARFDVRPGKDVRAVDRADDGAGQVVLPIGVEAGHLRGLATDQRASIGATGLGDPPHDRFDGVILDPPCGQVVQKKERSRALNRDVVDAVVHQVGPHSMVDAELERHFQLGANAIRAGDQYRIGKFIKIKREQSAETSDLRKHVFIEGLARQHLDTLLGPIAGSDVHPRVGVGDGSLLGPCIFWPGSGPGGLCGLVLVRQSSAPRRDC